MSERRALYRSVLADVDDDVARLVFADWLQEHGEDARAEFIRVQCGMARLSPADVEYHELRQRSRELEECFGPAWRREIPRVRGFRWDAGEFARGFVEVVELRLTGLGLSDKWSTRLDRVVAETPARTLSWSPSRIDGLATLLASPAFGRIDGLNLTFFQADDLGSVLARSPALARLRRLTIQNIRMAGDDLFALARSEHLERLDVFDLSALLSLTAPLRELLASPACRGLRHFALNGNSADDDALAMLAAGPVFPELQRLTLHIGAYTDRGLAAIAASSVFPKLAELHLCYTSIGAAGAQALAGARHWRPGMLMMAKCRIGSTGLRCLLESDILASLHEWNLHENDIGPGGIQSLTKSPRLAGLRRLDLDENRIGGKGLAALAACPHFDELLHLDLSARAGGVPEITPADVCHFLANFHAPKLRELRLNHLPVGPEGVRRLTEPGRFENLRSLHLEGAGLGDEGAKALIGSSELPKLMWVDLRSNGIVGGAVGLEDHATRPALVACDLRGNDIEPNPAARLCQRGGVRV